MNKQSKDRSNNINSGVISLYKYIMPSIHNRSVFNYLDGEKNYRIEMAKYQNNIPVVDKKLIIKYVNEFLKILGMEECKDPVVYPLDRPSRRFTYSKYNPQSKEDIVWIKFNEDGRISVVGTSCDISFSDYAKDHTTAGIINKALNLKWDESEVLIFPLINIPENLYRSDIESGIGNYLIAKGVPILDYYSHNY